MTKLIALVLAFTALVAFATAHTTIVTTTIEDDKPISQCPQQIQGQRLDQCRMFLQQDQSPYEVDIHQKGQRQQIVQQCCQQLQNVDEQCQCDAVKQVFRDVQKQREGQQSGRYGSQQTQQLKQKAQMLPSVCNLRCQLGSNIDIPFWPFGRDSGSQQCSQSEIRRPVNQCQRYVQEQMRSPRTPLMSVNRRGEEQQEMQECCNELQNLNRHCQCEAIQEVARELMQQSGLQYGRQQHQGSRRSGGQQDEMEIVRRIVQNLPNQCDLEVPQCSIPYGMF